MEMIKNILSGHSSKDTSDTGEGSHFEGHDNFINPEDKLGESASRRGVSEASTDQGGHKLSASHAGQGSHLAGATSGLYTSETQDTRQMPPIVADTGNAHGSGKELGSTAAAKVTPGFADDIEPGYTQQRSFPLSSSKTDASTTAIYRGVSNPGSSTTGFVSGANTGGVAGTGNSHQNDSGYYGTAQGPHTTHTANLLDPALSLGVGREDAVHHSERHGGGAEEADTHHSSTSQRGILSREAALGTAAAAGVGGATEHERNKHRDGFIGSGATPEPSTVPVQYGINTTTASSQLTTAGTSVTHSGKPNYGGDAAIAAGVAGAEAGAYAADKHIKSSNTSDAAPLSARPAETNTIGTGNHHRGRDAAVAGGAGAAGVAAYQANQHKHDKDLTEAEREAKKQQKHAEKEAKKGHHHEKHGEEKEHKGSALSSLRHDKNKTYTPEEKFEFDRQEREHHSHAGQNAAVGATGAAAYESEKPRQASEAGTIGTPLDQKPIGKDIGDHLHGDRNRGVEGASGFPGTSGFGSGTAYQPKDWREAVEHAKQHNPNASTKELKAQEVTGAGIGSSHVASGGDTASSDVGHTSGNGMASTQHQSRDVPRTGAGAAAAGGLAHRQAVHNTSSNYDTSTPSVGNQYGTTDATTTTTSRLGSHVPSRHAESTTNSGFSSKTSTSDATPRTTNTSEAGAAHVPASGATRADMIGDAREGIDPNTGVANADKKMADNY